jgi:hypothetical protein
MLASVSLTSSLLALRAKDRSLCGHNFHVIKEIFSHNRDDIAIELWIQARRPRAGLICCFSGKFAVTIAARWPPANVGADVHNGADALQRELLGANE